MYERNAIVLERYFDKLFGFSSKNNLKENYFNYRKLLEDYKKYTLATEAENKATEEFNQVSNEIAKIQKTQEKLYNKGVKFEYSRYVIFNNIEEKPKEIEKYLSKVEKDITQNTETLKELDEDFVAKVIEYNEKKETLEKCQKENREAKEDFETILEKTKASYLNIPEDYVNIAKEFTVSENKDIKKELTGVFEENGKKERNQFDPDVISNTVNTSIDIYKIEVEIYLTAIDKTNKLLNEIDIDSVKMDRHKKFYNDSKAKLDFINAQKEYLVQFLDNERIAAIYDKKIHRKLMLEACRNLIEDLGQINKLYDLILKEIAGRSTKRAYKENYNKEYLISMEQKSLNADLEASKVKTNSVAVVNLNYWRIEGIRRVYEVFDEDVTEIYNKDLSEFQPVIEQEQIEEPQIQEIQEVKIEKPKVEEIEVEEAKAEKIKDKEAKIQEEDTKIAENKNEKIKKEDSKIVETKGKDIVEKENLDELETEQDIFAGIENLKNFKEFMEDIEEQKEELQEIEVAEKPKKDKGSSKKQEQVEIIQEVESKENKSKKSKHKFFKSSKQALAKAIYISLHTHEFKEETDETKEDDDSYFDVDAKIAELDVIDNMPINKLSQEKSILDAYFNNEDKDTKKRKSKDKKKLLDGKNSNKVKKSHILNKISNINSRTKHEA